MKRSSEMKHDLSAAGIALGLIGAIAVCAWLITMRSVYGAEVFPPMEYDYPYQGRMIEIIVSTDEELAKVCWQPVAQGHWKAGCAYALPAYNLCVVYILDERLLRARGETLERTRRHERGHCNGWKHD
jgi:hypothetical protein